MKNNLTEMVLKAYSLLKIPQLAYVTGSKSYTNKCKLITMTRGMKY